MRKQGDKGTLRRFLAIVLSVALMIGNAGPAYAANVYGMTEETAAPVPEAEGEADNVRNAQPKEAEVPVETADPVISEELVGNGESGSCGNNVSWQLNDGKLTVSGTGAMTSAPWQELGIKNSITSVVIENGVTEICEDAFRTCTNIKSFVMADTVTLVDTGALSYCTSLTDLVLSANLKTIAQYAFSGCNSLKSISVPGGVAKIDNYAFYGCNSLANIDIQEGVKRIGLEAFSNCNSFTEIVIPASVTEIAEGAFKNCYLAENVYISNDSFRDYAFGTDEFGTCNKTILHLPFYLRVEDLAAAYDGAVFDWYEANPNSVISDFRPAGYEDSLIEGSCGDSVSWRIEGRQLTISGTGEMESAPWKNGGAFANVEKVVIEEGVTGICTIAFENGWNITRVSIASTVTTVGRAAFSYCTGLESINLPENLKTIERSAFIHCSLLKEVVIPGKVESIGDYAFSDCEELTTVTLPAALNGHAVRLL